MTEPPTPPGQETVRDAACIPVSAASPVEWYGLILQSGTGSVATAKFATQPGAAFQGAATEIEVLDADPLTPGKNSISVGEDPVAIHTDPAGCHAITANAGSCDLSVIHLNTVFDTVDDVSGPDEATRVDRLEVKNASGAPFRARPAAMAGEPTAQAIGNRCPATPQGLVYVAYPSCHLVAAVDTSTGTIVAGVQYGAAGTPTIVGGDVTCPDECDGGAAATAGVRPVALDLELDPGTSRRRLVIGADNSASITVVELDAAWRPGVLAQIPLEDSTGNLGITALALSREIGMGGYDAGPNVDVMINEEGEAFQFVYAVATDGTVRVADVLNELHECDTQVDARFARKIQSVPALSCLPIGTLLTPRRAGARGPGIHLPGEAIPLSVELFRSSEPIRQERAGESPGTLLGHFAVITASNGSTFIVNVDDDSYPDVADLGAPLKAPVQLAMAHQLRDAAGFRSFTIDSEDALLDDTDNKGCDYNGQFDQAGDPKGGPRAAATPTRVVPAGTHAPEKLVQLPGFSQLRCERPASGVRPISELVYAAPADVRDRSFPDLLALPRAETWTLVWEGSLSLSSGSSDVDGPAIREAMLTSDSLGMHLLDDAKPFCDAGVEPFDILQLRGCDPAIGAADCPTGYTCFVHPESQLPNFGSCMLSDEADRLADACKDFLTTLRRYTVKTTASGELLAVARRHELRTTPLDGCVSNQQCELLADQAARAATALHPFESTTSDPGTWECVDDPGRAPMGGTGKRCELRCDPDPAPGVASGCLTGTVCRGGTPGTMTGFCMESVVPPQSCINATQRYELRAGEAFAVIGSQSGFVHPIIADAAGQCVRDPMASRLSIGRLPLAPKDRLAPDTLHACVPGSDPLTGEISPGGGFEPNPCSTTVPHTEALPLYVPGTCTRVIVDGVPQTYVPAPERQAPAVRFRNQNLTLTLVDPTYPGDQTCIADRQANLGLIPWAMSGLTLSFRQTGGFAPGRVFSTLPADSVPSFPVKVVRGPTDSLWVIDAGDFLSSSGTQASTRGKVLRFHPRSLGAVNVLK